MTVLMYREAPLDPDLRSLLVPVARVDGLASIYRLSRGGDASPAEPR
jgi:hypothetical protein